MRVREVVPLHEEIYESLRAKNIVRDKAEFARTFFGRSRNYLHVLAHGQLSPSKEAYGVLREQLVLLSQETTGIDSRQSLGRYIDEIDRSWLSEDVLCKRKDK